MSVYKRGAVWWVKVQAGGQIVRQSAHTSSRRVALAFEQQIRDELGRIARGGKPRRTFDELMARFVREHFPVLRPGAARRYVVSIKALAPHFEGRFLDQIGRSALSDFIAARKRSVSTATIRRDLACLSSAFELGIDWDWCDVNPVRALRKSRIAPEGKPRTRYLSREEFDRLCASAQPYLEPMIRFAVATGLRLEEQLSLTWDRIDRGRQEIRVEGTKTGTGHADRRTGNGPK